MPPPDRTPEDFSTSPSDLDGPGGRSIRLDQFLKLAGIAATGGQAKRFIQSGEVFVNGEQETRRRRKLFVGDVVQVEGDEMVVEASD